MSTQAAERQVSAWLASAPTDNIDFGPEAEFYDDIYGDSDSGWPFWREHLAGAGHVVEVGSGTGRLTVLLASLATRVTGVEPATEMLRSAHTRLAKPTNVVLHQGSARMLPVPDGSATDVVIPYSVLNYLLRPDHQLEALREAHRALCKGGRLIVDVNYYPLGHPHTQGSTSLKLNFQRQGKNGVIYVMGDSILDRDWNVCQYTQIIDYVGPGGAVRRVSTPHHIHLFTPFELYFAVLAAGFEVDACYGGFDKSPPSSGSQRLIIIGRRM